MDLVSLEKIQNAYKIIQESEYFTRTSLLKDQQNIKGSELSHTKATSVCFKLENQQVTGSYKIRGVIVMLDKLAKQQKDQRVISMSAGNFGRSFAFLTSKLHIPCVIAMPDTAPQDRIKAIEGFGASVNLVPKTQLQQFVDEKAEKENMKFCHPFDDVSLFEG
jgi:threonine dehydratase